MAASQKAPNRIGAKTRMEGLLGMPEGNNVVVLSV